MRLAVLGFAIAAAGVAHADSHRSLDPTALPSGSASRSAHGALVEVDAVPFDGSLVPRVLYLDRCAGNCVIGNTGNDATTNQSTIPQGKTSYTLSAYAFGDDEWKAVVKCVSDVFSPYDITVVDTKPDSGTLYDKTFVAGLPSEIGQAADVLGIAPLAANCAVLTNNVAFAFANQHTPSDRVNNVCWTVSQETAHMYGLLHEFQFTNGDSACNDPMTYRNDCGGEKFFRDRAAQCGDFALADCKPDCKRTTQNSDALLLEIFGPHAPTTTPPAVSIVVPAVAGVPVSNGFAVQAKGKAQRGIARMELVLNGHTWLAVKGTGFGPNGQPEVAYALQFPAKVPDGMIDIQVRGVDDIGVATLSPAITVTKGAACTSAATCLENQRCDAGRCLWDPPTADVGATCTYNEACITNACVGGTCEQPCDPASTSARDVCPGTDVCGSSGGQNVCQPAASGGGCCSSSRDGAPQAVLGMFGLALVLGRRRRC